MNARRNRAMLALLGGDPEFTEPSSLPIPEGLTRLIAEGFEQIDGCVLSILLASSRSSTLARLKTTEDETGVEAAINEINIEKYVPEGVPFFELARLGCDFGFALGKELQAAPVDGPFRVVISLQPADPLHKVGNTCTVRFHRVRLHQPWINEDLEGYEEPVEVVDF